MVKKVDVKSQHQGFTLIELLVVLVIVGILAAILFPVFARARKNAQRASCMSNMKQMGVAIMMYAQDYDGHLLKYQVASSNPSFPNAWTTLIQPYLKSWQVFIDPSSGASLTKKSAQLGPLNVQYYVDYGYNHYYLGNTTLTAIANPSETVEVADDLAGNPGTNSGKLLAGFYYLLPPSWVDVNCTPTGQAWWKLYQVSPTCYGGRITQRHFDGANVLWVDGHVKWEKLPGPLTKNDTLWDIQ